MPSEEQIDTNSDAIAKLIAAIFENAIQVATSKYSKNTEKLRKEARDFLNKDNPMFKFYCDMIGVQEDWLANRLWEKVREKEKYISENPRKKRRK